MKKILLAASMALFASAAYAADPMVMEEVAPVGDWTGFYAGVQLGGAFGDSGIFSLDRNGDGAFGDTLAAFAPGFSGSFDSGVVGGVHAGYDWQMGSIVFGGILDVSATDIGDRQSGFSTTPAFYHIDRDLDWMATARARIGYAFGDRFLAYGTAGLAYGDVKYNFVSNTPAASVITGGHDSEIGYTVGGGIDAKVTEKISIGLEYLYTNLGGNDYNVRLSGPAAFSGAGSPGFTNAQGSDDDFDFHTVQVKMSYHF